MRVFGAPRALGIALRAAGLARGGREGLALLRESVAALDGSPALLERASARDPLAADGRSNREIAGELYVTLKTVEGHLARAYAKLGIEGRSQLA